MTAVQKIKAAIGKADTKPLTAPFGEPVIEHREIEYDLLLGRERGRRQNARAQLGNRYARGAALANHNGSGRIRRANSRLESSSHRQQRRKCRRHGIAGAGNIAHLDRVCRHVDRWRADDEERHALFATCHQHRFALDHACKFGSRGRDLRIGARRPSRRLGKLLAVGGDDRCATIN